MSNYQTQTWSSNRTPQASARRDRTIRELATVFCRADEAIRLVEASGFSPARVPAFSTPMVFWGEIVRQTDNGALNGGLDTLLRRAIESYPANLTFIELLRECANQHPNEDPLELSSAIEHQPKPKRPIRPFRQIAILAITIVTLAPLSIWTWKKIPRDILRETHPSIVACTIRIEGIDRIGRGWVMNLDSGEAYEVEINGSTVAFQCPVEGCEVAFIVDLNKEEIRHWARVMVAPEASTTVSLSSSTEGTPESFAAWLTTDAGKEPNGLDPLNTMAANQEDVLDSETLARVDDLIISGELPEAHLLIAPMLDGSPHSGLLWWRQGRIFQRSKKPAIRRKALHAYGEALRVEFELMDNHEFSADLEEILMDPRVQEDAVTFIIKRMGIRGQHLLPRIANRSSTSYSDRHRIHKIALKSKEIREHIDWNGQILLDLIQAFQTTTPCAVYRNALEAIQEDPTLWRAHVATLESAAPPSFDIDGAFDSQEHMLDNRKCIGLVELHRRTLETIRNR